LPHRAAAANPIASSYRTRDERVIVLCMLQSERFWPGLCEVIGRPDLIHDPRFDTAEKRTANVVECTAVLDAVFAERTLAEWKEILSRQDGAWDVIQKAGEWCTTRRLWPTAMSSRSTTATGGPWRW
jgi:crotonobetainyl-CoA:carnitine CoA-transferase CaiB-like acyl-CoA transferase